MQFSCLDILFSHILYTTSKQFLRGRGYEEFAIFKFQLISGYIVGTIHVLYSVVWNTEPNLVVADDLGWPVEVILTYFIYWKWPIGHGHCLK